MIDENDGPEGDDTTEDKLSFTSPPTSLRLHNLKERRTAS